MEKAKIIGYDIRVKVDWECPVCEATQHSEYSLSAYRSMSEDPIDEQCVNCLEFVTLTMTNV
jgi:hypothetical protein